MIVTRMSFGFHGKAGTLTRHVGLHAGARRVADFKMQFNGEDAGMRAADSNAGHGSSGSGSPAVVGPVVGVKREALLASMTLRELLYYVLMGEGTRVAS